MNASRARVAGLAQAWLHYAALRLGRSGLTGVALLVACALVLGIHALRDDTGALQQCIAQARAELQRTPTAHAAARTPQSLLAELPAAEQVPDFIEAVHHRAEQAGLQIERAEYRAPVLASGQVLRSQMVLPVNGPYPALASWLADVLRDHPSAALDEITVQRDAVATDQLHARVVLSHYSRSGP